MRGDIVAPAPGFRCVLNGPAAALAFGLSSVLFTLFNKAVLSQYQFPSPNLLTLCQCTFGIAVLLLLRRHGVTHFPLLDFDIARKLSVLFVMLEEYILMGIMPDIPTFQSTMVIALGASIAATNDLSFDMESYIFVLLANICSSLYSTYINVARKGTGLDAMGMLYYNYLVLLPFVAALTVTYELEATISFTSLHNTGFQISLAASVVLAVLVNIFGFYCTVLNSARTKTVTSSLKTSLTMTLGVYLFGDYVYSPINLLGVCVGFAGSVWYSVLAFGRSSVGKLVPSMSDSTLIVRWSNEATEDQSAKELCTASKISQGR